jgi:integrase
MRQILFTKPEIIRGKTWYVYFRILNPLTNRLTPRKIYKGFKECKNNSEREKNGQKLVDELLEKLKSGWNPYDRKDVVYVDELEYHASSVISGRKKKTPRDVNYYLSEYISLRSRDLKKKSLESYRSKLRLFALWLEDNGYKGYDVSAINNKIILNFFDHLTDKRKLAKPTIEKYKVNIEQFFKHLEKKKKVSINPVFGIVYPITNVDMSPRPIPESVLRKLLTYIQSQDPQLFLMCLFIYYTFLRPGQELKLLKIKDLDFAYGKVYVNSVSAKTSRAETVDIPEHLINLCIDVYQLDIYNPEFYVFGNRGKPGDTPYGDNTMRNRFNTYRDELGISSIYKFYSMKHTGAGALLKSGATIIELMAQLRHKELNSTHHYIRKHYGERNEKIRKHFPKPY